MERTSSNWIGFVSDRNPDVMVFPVTDNHASMISHIPSGNVRTTAVFSAFSREEALEIATEQLFGKVELNVSALDPVWFLKPIMRTKHPFPFATEETTGIVSGGAYSQIIGRVEETKGAPQHADLDALNEKIAALDSPPDEPIPGASRGLIIDALLRVVRFIEETEPPASLSYEESLREDMIDGVNEALRALGPAPKGSI